MAYSHQARSPMTLRGSRDTGAGALAMPRRRGASVGTMLVLLGIWGAIIPFVGPLFDYRMDTAASWTFTWDRLWLSILPGAAAFIGGLILLGAANRVAATAGSWLALAGGVWFVVGPTFSLLWNSPIGTAGVGVGSDTRRFIEQIGFSYGLGAVITALAAGALARVLVRSQRDALLLENGAGTRTAEAYPSTSTAEDYPVETRTGAAEGYPGETRVVPDEPHRAEPTAGGTATTPAEESGAYRDDRVGDQPPVVQEREMPDGRTVRDDGTDYR